MMGFVFALFVISLVFSAAEAWIERDWPTATGHWAVVMTILMGSAVIVF